MAGLALLGISGCGRQSCPGSKWDRGGDKLKRGSMMIGEAAKTLERWVGRDEGSGYPGTCAALEALEQGPEEISDWLAQSTEEDVAALAERARKATEAYDQVTGIRLNSGLGVALGVMLQRTLATRDLALGFRSGLTLFQFWTALRGTERVGWMAFESGLREILRSHPMPRSGWSEEVNAWKDQETLRDLVAVLAGTAADTYGLSDEEWNRVLTAIENGFAKARDPGSWEEQYGTRPSSRDSIEKEYRTTFKTPLAVATP